MNLRLVPLSLAVAVAFAAPHVDAQTVPWRAVIGTNSSVVVPGLPSTPRSYSDILLSDAGAGRVGVRMTSSGMLGYWAYRVGVENLATAGRIECGNQLNKQIENKH